MNRNRIIEQLIPACESLFESQQILHGPELPRAAEAALILALARSHPNPVVWICDGRQALETMHRDLATLAGEASGHISYYPPHDILAAKAPADDPDIAGNRLDTLLRLSSTVTDSTAPAPLVVTTCIQAVMQKIISPNHLATRTTTLAVGNDLDTETLTAFLTNSGYRFNPEVVEKGSASIKGGLLDLWPPTQTWPVRIEFFGSTVESIRTFDPATQRSTGRLDRIAVPPASDKPLPDQADSTLLSGIPPGSIIVWSGPDSILEHATLHEETATEAGATATLVRYGTIEAAACASQGLRQLRLGLNASDQDPAAEAALPAFRHPGTTYRFRQELFQPDAMEESRRRLFADLSARTSAGDYVFLFLDTPGSLDHHRKLLEKSGCEGVHTETGTLSEGFLCDALKLMVVSESDLYGTRKTQARRYDPTPAGSGPDRMIGMRISDLTDMEPGDLVVHADHGIGKYRGLNEIIVNGQLQEVLSIEYAEKAKLHVPVSQAHLLSRYVGLSRRNVKLHTLGGKGWARDKSAAQRSIADLASSLLETQAQRSHLQGHAFPPDTQWQYEFEASFPHAETRDQQRIIREIKHDMESSRPMDRLVCGDAGYGKTEVAMRAAFKAVMNAKQVAVMVPTTVLAQQHFETFTERMAPYPIRVEMLSRFCSQGRHDTIIKALAEGAVDIVIGTHSLLQPDIAFKDLGLVIVDEEQRFGVAHKEKFKQIRRLVDILTLTATPIPRTLYMSMSGARDMSLLQTPPRERMAIETIVARNTDEVVREAILREIGRDGQVFYLHNRVMTIELVRRRLEETVPGIRIAVAHGQMSAGELATVMKDFVNGESQVLLCTTIIESGVDIPRANTILIDRADRFGMADLYQLRGRVGRSSQKGYAYLLIPAHGCIDTDARNRIGAIKKYSGLSAGFNIALRDLEIRGAGNMLGAEQSGHISAIGFGLYCQLLRRSVAHLKNEPVPPVIDVNLQLDFIRLTGDAASECNSAVIPYGYVEDEKLRIGVYRKIAEAATLAELATLREEFTDRFGPLPPPLNRLLKMAEIRIICAGRDINSVEAREDKVMFRKNNDYIMTGGKFPRLKATTPDDKLDEIIRISKSLR